MKQPKPLTGKEQHEINKINQEAHDRFGSKLFTKEQPMLDEKKRIEERLDWNKTIDSSKKLDKWKEDRVRRLIDDPKYEQETSKLNEQVAAKHEAFIDARIKKLRARMK